MSDLSGMGIRVGRGTPKGFRMILTHHPVPGTTETECLWHYEWIGPDYVEPPYEESEEYRHAMSLAPLINAENTASGETVR